METTFVRWMRVLLFGGVACLLAGFWFCQHRGSWLELWAFPMVIAGALAGFSPYDPPFSSKASRSRAFELHTIQFDDFGSLWDVAQAEAVLQGVKADADHGNTFVVVFVHGWHHNAKPSDDNLLDFECKRLHGLHVHLTTPSRSALRAKLTGSADVKLIGLYLGWRGRSLPVA